MSFEESCHLDLRLWCKQNNGDLALLQHYGTLVHDAEHIVQSQWSDYTMVDAMYYLPYIAAEYAAKRATMKYNMCLAPTTSHTLQVLANGLISDRMEILSVATLHESTIIN